MTTAATECGDCGHLFNTREARWGPYDSPKCYQCAQDHNAQAKVLRMLMFTPTAQRDRKDFCYVPPDPPEPALRPDGYVDLGVLADRRGIETHD